MVHIKHYYISLIAIKKVMGVTGAGEIVKVMNTRITGGETSIYVINYLERANCLLHDSVLKKLSNAFFAGF